MAQTRQTAQLDAIMIAIKRQLTRYYLSRCVKVSPKLKILLSLFWINAMRMCYSLSIHQCCITNYIIVTTNAH